MTKKQNLRLKLCHEKGVYKYEVCKCEGWCAPGLKGN